MKSIAEYNAFLTGLSFFLVFCGWSAISNITTSTRGDIGSYSLSIVYFVLTISNLITSLLLSTFHPKYIMFYGSLTYVLYIGLSSYTHPIVLYISSILLGIGAASIWVSQQLYITQCSNYYEIRNNLLINSKLGYFNGLFYMIYSFKKIIGNFIAAFLIQIGESMFIMYSILTLLSACGTISFLLLKPMDIDEIVIKNKKQLNGTEAVNLLTSTAIDNEDDVDETDDDTDDDINDDIDDDINDNIKSNKLNELLKIFKLWKNKDLWCLVPFTLYCGMDAAFVNGIFPLFVNGTKNKFYIISYSGLILCIFSIIVGKLSDKIGRIIIILISACCQGIVYCESILHNNNYNDNNILYLLFLSTLIGISGSGYLTQISSIYPIILGREPEVFANFKLFQSLTMSIAFWMETKMSIQMTAKLNLGMLIFGIMPLILIPSIRQKLQKPKQISESK